MIQKLFDDNNISDDLSTVLINTLYLKSGWKDSFNAFDTKQDKFTTVFGEKVVKNFMYQQNDVQYYEDNKTQLIVLPLKNGVSMAFVMGDDDNIFDKIKQSKYECVNIKIPKMEISTAVESDILIDFLQKNGCVTPFSNNADFSGILHEGGIKINNIMQKTKIKTDEEGLEASAATAIMTDGNAFMPEQPKKIYEFTANKPFSFFIFEETTSELLFFGKLNV